MGLLLPAVVSLLALLYWWYLAYQRYPEVRSESMSIARNLMSASCRLLPDLSWC